MVSGALEVEIGRAVKARKGRLMARVELAAVNRAQEAFLNDDWDRRSKHRENSHNRLA
jgi:hypothetical protein